MNTRRIPVITKLWLAMFLVFALLPTAVIAASRPTLNEQLITAAGRGDLAQVKILLNKGADPNARDEEDATALMWASGCDHPGIVKLLLKKGADVNARDVAGGAALISASTNGHLGVVKILLKKGADANAQYYDSGGTALMWAVQHGHTDVVKLPWTEVLMSMPRIRKVRLHWGWLRR